MKIEAVLPTILIVLCLYILSQSGCEFNPRLGW